MAIIEMLRPFLVESQYFSLIPVTIELSDKRRDCYTWFLSRLNGIWYILGWSELKVTISSSFSISFISPDVAPLAPMNIIASIDVIENGDRTKLLLFGIFSTTVFQYRKASSLHSSVNCAMSSLNLLWWPLTPGFLSKHPKLYLYVVHLG